MILNNYILDGHAYSIFNKKIDDQRNEIICLRERIRELENERFSFSFNTYPEIINVEHQSKLLKIIADVGIYKNLTSPGHHCIAKFQGNNCKQFSYHVSDDIFNIIDNNYLSAMLINMHKQLINSILEDIIKEKI